MQRSCGRQADREHCAFKNPEDLCDCNAEIFRKGIRKYCLKVCWHKTMLGFGHMLMISF